MKFKVVGESFNKYTEKVPEKRDSHTDDETPEHKWKLHRNIRKR